MTVIPEPVDWTGLAAKVAAVMRARTRQGGTGAEAGVFDASTRPTITQVQEIIDASVGHVVARFGPDLLPRLHGIARDIAVYRTAYLVELSYWPEQLDAEHSPAEHYRTMWQDGIDTLTTAAHAVDTTGRPRIGMADTTPPRVLVL